jgi:soluble lytic murein transglycosylase-like protein
MNRTSLLAVLPIIGFGSPCYAEVFEISQNGEMVETTTAVWRETPVAALDRPATMSPSKGTQPSPTYHAMVSAAAERYNVSSALIDAVAWQESRYRINAVSSVGAVGLMQLMPATARSLGVMDSFDPQQNIAGGAAYLRLQLNRFDNDLERALAAYNAGPGAVTKYGGIPPYRETQNYVRSIMNRLAQTALQSIK